MLRPVGSSYNSEGMNIFYGDLVPHNDAFVPLSPLLAVQDSPILHATVILYLF